MRLKQRERNKGRFIPSGSALVPESYGFLRWEVNHNKPVSPSLSRVLDGLFFSICKHRIVISYETGLSSHNRFDRTRLTHKEHRCLESLVPGRFDLTEHLSVGNTLLDSDLQAGSGKAREFGRISTMFDSWMTGPSAEGSENGTPSSMISAPPRSIANKISTVSLAVG